MTFDSTGYKYIDSRDIGKEKFSLRERAWGHLFVCSCLEHD